MGVPIPDERSRGITIFGGKLRAASPRKFVLSGIICFHCPCDLRIIQPSDEVIKSLKSRWLLGIYMDSSFGLAILNIITST